MTYKEYDNAWLEESGMPCLIPPMIFRNGFTSYYYLYSEQIGDSRFSLNASGITGSATLMHTNTISTSVDPSVGSVIRNEEYIYFYNHKTDTNPFIGEIVEYKISDGSKTYIEYASSATRIAYDISMAFIEERKLIIFDWTYEYADTGHIYIVDFDTLTCTEQFTIPYEVGTRVSEIRSVACIKDNNNDLHLLVIVDYYDHNLGNYGIEIRYKDYTNGGAWTTYAKDIEDEGAYTVGDIDQSGLYQYTIVNNRYLVVPVETMYEDIISADYYYYSFYVFDINTVTLDYKTWFVGADPTNGHPQIIRMKVDNTNNKVYFENPGYSYPNMAYTEFDPSTMTFGWKYDSGSGDGIGVFSTQEYAYAYDYNNSNIYKASTVALEGNYTLPIDYENTCYLMDDVVPMIWFWDNTDNHIKAIDLDGSIIKNIDPSITPGSDYTCIIHMGDCLVVSTDNYGTNPSYRKYYLIT